MLKRERARAPLCFSLPCRAPLTTGRSAKRTKKKSTNERHKVAVVASHFPIVVGFPSLVWLDLVKCYKTQKDTKTTTTTTTATTIQAITGKQCMLHNTRGRQTDKQRDRLKGDRQRKRTFGKQKSVRERERKRKRRRSACTSANTQTHPSSSWS